MNGKWSDSNRNHWRAHIRRGASAMAAIGLTCMALYSATSQAQPYKGSWKPASTTATSITGKVTLDSQKITFAGAGKPMVLDTRLVEARPSKWLFAVTGSKSGPVPLINENSLCAPGILPTYVIAAMSKGELQMGVSSSEQPPSLDWTGYLPPGDCGVYNYYK